MTLPSPPWKQLVARRKAAGLTQTACADGIVTQSMLCQIERGRVLPSNRTIRLLAERLFADAECLIQDWQPWRDRRLARDELWIAYVTESAQDIRRLLDVYGCLLAPFERGVYNAYATALQGDVNRADAILILAWKDTGDERALAAQTKDGTGAGYDTHQPLIVHKDLPWSRVDQGRAMVVEASVHAEISARTNRHSAAAWWRARAAERMKQTVWKSKAKSNAGRDVVQ